MLLYAEAGEALVEAGVLRRLKDGVRLLVKGELTTKVNIMVAGATKGALTVVEMAGGKVTVLVPPTPVDAASSKSKSEDA